MRSFAEKLTYGQAAESVIAKWLRWQGYGVIPVYEKILDTGKGPQVFLPDDELIAPDLLCFNSSKVRWIEAKHKNGFTWHRNTGKFQTGIDNRHFEDYVRISEETPWPCMLLFLHRGGKAKDSPESPSGLFGNYLEKLRYTWHHKANEFGAGGMIFWNIEALDLYASINTLKQCGAL